MKHPKQLFIYIALNVIFALIIGCKLNSLKKESKELNNYKYESRI